MAEKMETPTYSFPFHTYALLDAWIYYCYLFHFFFLYVRTSSTSNSLQQKAAETYTAVHSPQSKAIQSIALFTFLESLYFSQIFPYDILPPIQGNHDFRSALDVWPLRTTYGNLSSFTCRTWTSYLNLSVIIAPEAWIEPHSLFSLMFEIWSVSRVPKTICTQFLGKTSSKPSSIFRSANASGPYLTTVITLASIILVLAHRLTLLVF